jgi:hypothetical protein
MMLWDETDVISVLEVLPDVGEDGIYHDFHVERDGLRLQFTVFQWDGDVRVRLWYEGLSAPVFEMQVMDCPGIRRLFNSVGTEYLEVAAGQLSRVIGAGETPMAATLIVAIKPQIAVRLTTSDRA